MIVIVLFGVSVILDSPLCLPVLGDSRPNPRRCSPLPPPQATSYTLTVQLSGNATGTVTSTPAGIRCSPTCSASFASGTSVKLTAVAATGDYFAGWSGACKGIGPCTLTMNANKSATAAFNVNQTVNVLNHIIFLAQENRSLDHYFGALRSYWKNDGFADRSFDGLPQFNPTSGLAPLYGPPPTNPGCDPAYPPPSDCTEDSSSPQIASYHLITQCIENPSPSWNESHVDWDLTNPYSARRLSMASSGPTPTTLATTFRRTMTPTASAPWATTTTLT